jgi:hypothetical protein
LEITKLVKNFRLVFEKKKPCELVVIIDKRYIILESSNKNRSVTPNIGEHQLQWDLRHTNILGKGQLMALCPLTHITHQCIYLLFGAREIIATKNTLDYRRRGMAETIVPPCHRQFDGAQNTFIDSLLGQDGIK